MSPASYRAAPPRAVGLAAEVTPPYDTGSASCKSASRTGRRGRGAAGGRGTAGRRGAARGSRSAGGRRSRPRGRARRAARAGRRLGVDRPLQRLLQPLLRLAVGGEVLLGERSLTIGDRLLRLGQSLTQPLLRRLGGAAGAATRAVAGTRRPGVTGGGAGVTAEHLVERLVQGVGEADLVTEADEDLLEQRVRRVAGAADVDRLHVQQTAADGQGQQVAALHRGL